METLIFQIAVNAGALRRGSVINAGPTQSTRVDNALSPTGGCVDHFKHKLLMSVD